MPRSACLPLGWKPGNVKDFAFGLAPGENDSPMPSSPASAVEEEIKSLDTYIFSCRQTAL